MKEVTLKLPEDIQDVMGQRRDLAREIIKRLAVSLYAERKISLGKAVELSGTDHSTFLELLGDFGVNLDYDEEDLDNDLHTMRGLRSGGNM